MRVNIPALYLFLATVLCALSVNAATKSGADFVVVVDAGHGGHDAGALGKFTNEKTINLAVAKLLGEKLSHEKGVRVVYTRSTDKFVTLQGRADVANKANGDLFVSIHINSIDANNKNRTSVRGAAVYTLGLDRTDDNLAVAMRENSVMKLENDYSTTYQGFDPNSAESYIIFELNQNKYLRHSVSAAKSVCSRLASIAGRKNNGVKQANFWVLLKTAMPSMLVELDFICNPDEEKFMASSNGQEKLAEALYRGIMDYKNSVSVPAPAPARQKATVRSESRQAKKTVARDKNTPVTSKAHATTSETSYKIQFLTSPKRLREGCSEFKGLKNVDFYSERGINKYTYGDYDTASQAVDDLKRIKKLFPDAFVIKTIGGSRVKQ